MYSDSYLYYDHSSYRAAWSIFFLLLVLLPLIVILCACCCSSKKSKKSITPSPPPKNPGCSQVRTSGNDYKVYHRNPVSANGVSSPVSSTSNSQKNTKTVTPHRLNSFSPKNNFDESYFVTGHQMAKKLNTEDSFHNVKQSEFTQQHNSQNYTRIPMESSTNETCHVQYDPNLFDDKSHHYNVPERNGHNNGVQTFRESTQNGNNYTMPVNSYNNITQPSNGQICAQSNINLPQQYKGSTYPPVNGNVSPNYTSNSFNPPNTIPIYNSHFYGQIQDNSIPKQSNNYVAEPNITTLPQFNRPIFGPPNSNVVSPLNTASVSQSSSNLLLQQNPSMNIQSNETVESNLKLSSDTMNFNPPSIDYNSMNQYSTLFDINSKNLPNSNINAYSDAIQRNNWQNPNPNLILLNSTVERATTENEWLKNRVIWLESVVNRQNNFKP